MIKPRDTSTQRVSVTPAEARGYSERPAVSPAAAREPQSWYQGLKASLGPQFLRLFTFEMYRHSPRTLGITALQIVFAEMQEELRAGEQGDLRR